MNPLFTQNQSHSLGPLARDPPNSKMRPLARLPPYLGLLQTHPLRSRRHSPPLLVRRLHQNHKPQFPPRSRTHYPLQLIRPTPIVTVTILFILNITDL